VVIPSLYEPFGIVALEAMAAKTPLVASAVGGLSEIIGEKEGLKVPPDNSDKLADAIIDVLTDAGGENARRVRAGYKKALSLSWNKIAEATLEAYTKAVQRRRSKMNGRAKGLHDSRGSLKIRMWEYS
ncbi:MAG TPA: glycosyltransferase, partial [Methanomicrobia archaeon]|nr:glycosyltransferase [Methanomicrobia archaeon]HEX59052.1 glycosyltransferase [Methanomicrobia archaeon]